MQSRKCPETLILPIPKGSESQKPKWITLFVHQENFARHPTRHFALFRNCHEMTRNAEMPASASYWHLFLAARKHPEVQSSQFRGLSRSASE